MNKRRYAPNFARFSNTSSPQETPPTTLPMFGVFRPTTPIWLKAADFALTQAQEHAWAFLSRQEEHDPEDFHGYDQHGATYLSRGNACNRRPDRPVTREMYQQMLGKVGLCEPEIGVPIDHFEWWGKRRHVLVACFTEDDPVINELRDERRYLRRALAQVGLRDLLLNQPDHVSLFRYDRLPSEPGLAEWQRDRIAGIMNQCAIDGDLLDVSLGSIVLGYGYNNPLWTPPAEEQMSAWDEQSSVLDPTLQCTTYEAVV